MRKTFAPQPTLGSHSISSIQIPTKCRDEFPQFLRAMQHIYTTIELRDKVLGLLKTKICTKKRTGRQGMDLWTIFVLAGARLCLNTDFDRLHYLSNNDNLLRQMLGVQDGIVRGREFELQTIIDNVSLLDETTLREINLILVEAGHKIVKKKETEALHVKIDSFVVEANVHFPTDYNLLYDSGRKCLDVLGYLIENNSAYGKGWRKREDWRDKLKNKMLTLSRSSADKSKNRATRLKKSAVEYLVVARQLSDKLDTIKPLGDLTLAEKVIFVQLDYYRAMLRKHIDLVNRRLLKGEKIPQEEKIFSIFEPWVEWISKGKAHRQVELGKPACIATDQWHFAIDWLVADHQSDNEMLIIILDSIRKRFQVSGCSGDKGFYSKENVELVELFDMKAVIPKKGKLSLSDQLRESEPAFMKLRRKHSAIESNINEFEHRGLDRCLDKGIYGLQRYVGLAVIAYNHRRVGKILLDQDRKAAERNAVKRRLAA